MDAGVATDSVRGGRGRRPRRGYVRASVVCGEECSIAYRPTLLVPPGTLTMELGFSAGASNGGSKAVHMLTKLWRSMSHSKVVEEIWR